MNYYLDTSVAGDIYSVVCNRPQEQPLGTVVEFAEGTTNLLSCLKNPSLCYVSNAQILLRPNLSLAYLDGTITATLNNPPSVPPTGVTFAVAGQTFTETLTNNVATLTLAVHPAVASQQIAVSISATGCVGSSINIGGTETSVGLHAFTPSGGISTIAPTGSGSAAYLEAYYATQISTQTLLADIGTAIGLVMHTLHDVVLPALQQSTYTPITLSADQTNAHSDVIASVLPNIYTTLANAYPTGGNRSVQYARYVQDQQASYSSFADYMRDVTTIPNLK